MNRVLALSRVELTLLLRNRSTATMALVLPLAFGAVFLFTRGDSVSWALALTLQILTAQGLTVYVCATSSFAARRQDLTLKRLRSGEVSDPEIIAGVLAPPVLLGLVQCALMVVIAAVVGAPLPTDPLALVLAIVGGTAVGAATAVLTASFTASPEAAQITTTPLFLATFGGAFWVLFTAADDLAPWMLAVPGGAVADLLRTAMGGAAGAQPPWMSVLALAAWIAVPWAVGRRYFRWDRRS